MRQRPTNTLYEGTGKLQVPPLRCAPVGMTRLGVIAPLDLCCHLKNLTLTLSSRPERTRISCYAALRRDHGCGFPQRKAHALDQRDRIRQENRGSGVEGPAVASSHTDSLAPEGTILHRSSHTPGCRRSNALYQGTTSVVPLNHGKKMGFSPCNTTSQAR
jgi:hypothetical protein